MILEVVWLLVDVFHVELLFSAATMFELEKDERDRL